jgi:hypothetical protein
MVPEVSIPAASALSEFVVCAGAHDVAAELDRASRCIGEADDRTRAEVIVPLL